MKTGRRFATNCLGPRACRGPWRSAGACLILVPLIAMVGIVWMTPAHAQNVVSVSTIEDLYAAVNNPANEGIIIDLAPGTYVLTPTDSSGNPRPNLGSLILPPGAVLRGHNEYVDLDGDGVWDLPDPSHPEIYADPATETIIDAFSLTGLTGAMNVITLGPANGVERLTVRNNAAAGPLIGVTLKPSAGGLLGVVRDCIVEGGQRGLRAQHRDSSFSGLDSGAVFERNISRHHVGIFSFGIQVQNGSVSNATWTVQLRHNRVYGNRFGLFVVAASSTNAEESILSENNIYEKNAVGVVLHGGRDSTATGSPSGSNDGRLRFDSVGDAIWNNSGNSGPLGTGGGVDARGAFRTGPLAGTSSDNHLRLQFIGARFVQGSGTENRAGTARRDMTVFGALGTGGNFPGSGNVVQLLIRQSLSDGSPDSFLLTDSDPTAPNEIEVIGSEQAVASTNVGITLEHK